MSNWFKKSNEEDGRILDHPSKLEKGDLISLKERSCLPINLQGQTLTVKSIGAYNYSDGLKAEFELEHVSGKIFYAMCGSESDGEYITFSLKLAHHDIESIFGLDEFSKVFDEDNSSALMVNRSDQAYEMQSWLPSSYYPSIRFGSAYYYDSDQRGNAISDFEDDGSDQVQFHEYDGDPDSFSLTIEVYEDGQTEVYLEYSCSLDLIEELWPHGERS